MKDKKIMFFTVSQMGKLRFIQEIKKEPYGVTHWYQIMDRKMESFDFTDRERIAILDLCKEYEFAMKDMQGDTIRAYAIIGMRSRGFLAAKIGITSRTLSTRLESQRWKHEERKMLLSLCRELQMED